MRRVWARRQRPSGRARPNPAPCARPWRKPWRLPPAMQWPWRPLAANPRPALPSSAGCRSESWRVSTSPSVPRPGTAWSCCGATMAMPCSWAAATTARARGCSLPLCRLAAMRSMAPRLLHAVRPSRGALASAPGTSSALRRGRPPSACRSCQTPPRRPCAPAPAPGRP
jgi:hypothetical protein